MALFLKYRPQTFDDLVGQDSVAKTLKNALKNNKPSHAYLFSGSRGTGKTSTARIFAKGLICPNLKDGNPCGECDFCTKTASGNLVDVIEIDGASNRGIDEIRDLREKILFAPTFADKKIYIIDEVHMLTTPAFNALLKTLEEPPEHAFFLLATTERHKLPATIISRCQTFIFGRFSMKQLIDRLKMICEKEKFEFEDKALELIAKKAEGGLRDAISLLEQISAETENNITEESVITSLGMATVELLEKFWHAIDSNDKEEGLEIIKKINLAGGDFRTFGHDFLGFLREKMHKSIGDNSALNKILVVIEEIEKAIFRLKTSPIMELPLEVAVINLTIEKDIFHTKEFIPPKAETKPIATPVPIKKEVVITPPLAKTEEPKNNDSGFVFDKEAKHTRTQQKIEEPVSQEIKIENLGELTVEKIQEKMSDIAKKSDLPSFSKMSFTATTPNIRDGKVFFRTENNFHIQKLQENSEVKNKLQIAMSEIFGQKIIIEFETIAKEPEKSKNDVATAGDFSEYFS